ncbi:MAG: nucleotide exchange factor GrpE [Victivallaceae bacterium]|nr:nucleotide exchange factor GrpE [Victivallaceae bacterium]
MEFDNMLNDDAMSIKQPQETAPGSLDVEDSAAPGLAAPAEDPAVALKKELDELNDKYLRLMADYQNYRKHVAKDLQSARVNAVEDTVFPFLQLFDHLSLAVKAAGETKNVDSIVKGLQLIDAQYQKALDELNICRFDAVNAKFDPCLHEAMADEPSDTVPEGSVVRQWCCGYKMGEKLLRPARVVVSGGKAKKEQK